MVDNTFFLGLTTENNYLFFLYTDFIDSVVACKKGITRRWFKVECVTQDECLKIVTYKKWNCWLWDKNSGGDVSRKWFVWIINITILQYHITCWFCGYNADLNVSLWIFLYYLIFIFCVYDVFVYECKIVKTIKRLCSNSMKWTYLLHFDRSNGHSTNTAFVFCVYSNLEYHGSTFGTPLWWLFP